MELSEMAGADDPADVYYTTLLQHVGCTGYAHEAAVMLGGDEIAVKRAAVHTDFGSARDIVHSYLPHLAPTAGVLTRLRVAGIAAVRAREIVQGYSRSNCEVAAQTAERIGLGEGVRAALLDVYEQWNGKGGPRGIGGDAIAQPTRIAQVAVTASLFHTVGGREAAIEAVRHRAGASLDPALVGLVCAEPGRVLGVLDTADALAAAVKAEPGPLRRVSELGLDRVCRAFGDVVDLKTPLHHGHAAGVAELAAGAAEQLALDANETAMLRRAGYVHDLGRAAIPNKVWEHSGPLSWAEEEQVRLHPHYSERVLARCGPLAALASLAGAHHERLDGSGYHRQLRAGGLGIAARVLATANAFQTMTQVRAHRPARTAEEAAGALASEARAGRLDADVVRAVVEAAGRPAPAVRGPRPAGLTERQVEVLRLVAQGLSNPKIAQRLVIARRTAEHHVQDVYARIGVSSRAGAALFAMEHDLLKDG
jgi:HD-GYP domain-containing protein (c-di-GMP phosphodiesterase class II)